MIGYDLVYDYEFFQHFLCLFPGATDSEYFKDQTQGGKVSHERRVDGLVELQQFPVRGE